MYYLVCFHNASGMWYYDSINYGGRYIRRHHNLLKLDPAYGKHTTIDSYVSYISQINKNLGISPSTAIIKPLDPTIHPELFI